MAAVGDVYLLRVVATFDSEPVINSMAFQVLNPAETFRETADNLITAVDGQVGVIAGGGSWTTGLSSQYRINKVEVHDIIPGLSSLYAKVSSAVGSVDDDDAMPPNDALCVTLRTEARGPGGRGRIYLTGFAEGAANGGYWEAGTQAYAESLMSALDLVFGQPAPTDFQWGVLHRQEGGAPLDPPVFRPGMSWSVNNEVRSIGRRAVGRKIRRRPVP